MAVPKETEHTFECMDQTAAQQLMVEIGKCHARDIEETGSPDVAKIAALITSSFLREPNTFGLALGIADYICLSIDGANPRPEDWQPRTETLPTS